MTTKEEIKEQLDKAEKEYQEAKKKLEKFEEGEDDGKLLKKLRVKLFNEEYRNEEQKKGWEEMVGKLEEEKKKLEESKERWEKQVEQWGEALRKFVGGGEGNEQIA